MKILSLLLIGLAVAAATNVCPDYTRTLPGTSTCLPAFGACKAASCDGNGINKSGFERECVVSSDKTNSGAQCPWGNNTWGIDCKYNSKCALNKGNNCYGYTYCAVGECPSSAVGVFCIESGVSNNFKVCGCDDVSCVVGGWGPWGPCVDGVQTRTRKVITPQRGTGDECPSLIDTQECIPNIDCVVGAWGPWGPCVDNIQVRERLILTYPSGTGKPCKELTDTQSCQPECLLKTKNDFFVTSYNKALINASVIANDQYVDTVEVVKTTVNGVLTLKTTGYFDYMPNQNFCGSDSFTYKASNGDCYSTEDVAITTTCGCGSVVETVDCILDTTQAVTECILPGGKSVLVPNLSGYTRVVIRINAKLTYKTK